MVILILVMNMTIHPKLVEVVVVQEDLQVLKDPKDLKEMLVQEVQ